MAYTSILVVLLGIEVSLLVTRSSVDATVSRARGLTFQEEAGGKISNLYSIQLLNKTHEDLPVSMKLESVSGEIKMIGKGLTVGKESFAQGSFFIIVDKSAIFKRKTNIEIGVYSGAKKIRTVTASFLSPITN
jgi:hypothetical protein